MAKHFKQMNKEELVAAAKSLGLTEEVVAKAVDPENITNAEYVIVLEAYKQKQKEINSGVNQAETDTVETTQNGGQKVDQFKKAELKNTKYKYIVTDHQSRVAIEDDNETRVFPISYGNITSGPKVWNVALHGREQALPISVAKRLSEIKMVVQTNDANGNPSPKTQPRFRVTKVDGWTQDEIDVLKRSQNTRKFN